MGVHGEFFSIGGSVTAGAPCALTRGLLTDKLLPSLKDVYGGNDYVIRGPRKIGKSTLLNQFAAEIMQKDDYVCLYVSMENLHHRDVGVCWTHELIAKLDSRLGAAGFDRTGRSILGDFFDSAEESTDKRVIVMLLDDVCIPPPKDDMEEVKSFLEKVRSKQNDRKSPTHSKSVWRFYCASTASKPQLEKIFALKNRSPFNECLYQELMPLTLDEIEEFAKRVERHHKHKFGKERDKLLSKVHQRTGGHPEIVQRLFQRLLEQHPTDPLHFVDEFSPEFLDEWKSPGREIDEFRDVVGAVLAGPTKNNRHNQGHQKLIDVGLLTKKADNTLDFSNPLFEEFSRQRFNSKPRIDQKHTDVGASHVHYVTRKHALKVIQRHLGDDFYPPSKHFIRKLSETPTSHYGPIRYGRKEHSYPVEMIIYAYLDYHRGQLREDLENKDELQHLADKLDAHTSSIMDAQKELQGGRADGRTR